MPARKKVILVCEAEAYVAATICRSLDANPGLQVINCPTMDDVVDYLDHAGQPDALLINEAAPCGPKTSSLIEERGDTTGLHGGLFLLLDLGRKGRLPPQVFLTTAQNARSLVGYEAEFNALLDSIGEDNVFFLPHLNLMRDILTRMGL